jgi:excisionase family DNA binding protein
LPSPKVRYRPSRQFLTSGELARLSNMSKRALVKAIASGRLQATSTVGGHYRIPLKTAREFLSARGLDASVLMVREDRALLVARDKFVRDLLADALDGPGMSSLAADNLFEAGALCREHRPALVVLDTALAGSNPIAVCRSIRGLDCCRQTRLLVLAGREDPDAHRYRLAGADAVLGKPFSMAELKSAIMALGLGTGRK